MALQEGEKILTTLNAASTFAKIKEDVDGKTTMQEVEAKGYIDDAALTAKNYVDETTLDNKGYLTAVPEEYITETELTEKGYIDDAALTAKNYIDATTLAEKNYVDEEALTAKGYITADQIPEASDIPVATSEEILALYNKTE